jgi:hypothetical protein
MFLSAGIWITVMAGAELLSERGVKLECLAVGTTAVYKAF